MPKSIYLSNALLRHIFMGHEFPMPTDVFVGLFTVAPTSLGGGVEVFRAEYARQDVRFGIPLNGRVTNSGSIQFPIAVLDWGTITSFGFFDALTGGNLLYFDSFATPLPINAGETAVFVDGQLVVVET